MIQVAKGEGEFVGADGVDGECLFEARGAGEGECGASVGCGERERELGPRVERALGQRGGESGPQDAVEEQDRVRAGEIIPGGLQPAPKPEHFTEAQTPLHKYGDATGESSQDARSQPEGWILHGLAWGFDVAN